MCPSPTPFTGNLSVFAEAKDLKVFLLTCPNIKGSLDSITGLTNLRKIVFTDCYRLDGTLSAGTRS